MNKLFSRTISTYILMLLICLFVKLIGLDYFGLELSNPFMIKINNILINHRLLNNIIFMIPLWVSQFVIVSTICNDNSKKMIKYNIILIPIYYIVQGIKLPLFGSFAVIFELLYFFIICKIYNKNVKIKRFIKINILIIFVELISALTRYNYSIEYITNRVASMLLSIDYIIMLIIIYKFNFMKGDDNLCGYLDHQFSSSGQQNSSKKQLRKCQIKSLNKKEKFEFIATWILYLLWNIFTLCMIFLIAFINDTIVECIFIVSSFWINKTVFGKPFHLKTAGSCFIVSNITYYVLNRITTPIGISILVPIILGICLSYFTSKLVKDNKVKLKRGMTEEEIKSKLDKINADPIDYKICLLFYNKGYKDLKIANMLNYSEINIKKRKQAVNKKLENQIF